MLALKYLDLSDSKILTTKMHCFPSSSCSQVETAMICFFSLLAGLTIASIGRLAFANNSSKGPKLHNGASETLRPNHDKLGAVSSLSSVCSRIGVDLLKAGGNAADAMLGTQFCVGVIGTNDQSRVLAEFSFEVRCARQWPWGWRLHADTSL